MISLRDFFVLRTPALPLQTLVDVAKSTRSVFSEQYYKEALFLASPDLYEAYQDWADGTLTDPQQIERIEVSLAKYIIRMAYRCTPFGLFSGVSVGSFGANTQLVVAEPVKHNRKTRIDMDYLCNLSTALLGWPSIRQHLHYFPNSTIYQVGNQTRYTQYRLDGRARTHHLITIAGNEALNTVLLAAKSGASLEQLAQMLVEEDISFEEAKEFIHELINEQILVSDLDPNITGKDYFEQLVQRLGSMAQQDASLRFIHSGLESVKQSIHKLDCGVNDISHYQSIAFTLKNLLDVPLHPQHLFQVDLFKQLEVGQLTSAISEDINQAVKLFSCIDTNYVYPPLEKFKKAFLDRFETQEVPLLTLLDSEVGLPYPIGQTQVQDEAPLLEGLIFSSPEHVDQQLYWGAWQHFLFTQYCQARIDDRYTIELTEEHLAPFLQQPSSPLPASSYAAGYLLAEGAPALDRGEYKFFIYSINGPSAANNLSRFCHLNEELAEKTGALLVEESKQYPGALMAELIHINQARLGNIVRRPKLRSLEIPVLMRAATAPNQTIQLQDLAVSVVDDRIVLRSVSLNQEVIPRLSTAHDFEVNALPVYYFLCDLQRQGNTPHLAFVWGSPVMADVEFLPRIEYKRLILSRARWKLSSLELANLFPYIVGHTLQAAAQLRQQRSIPRWVTVSEGDNELPIDLEDEMYLRVLATVLKNKKTVMLEECLRTPDKSIVQGSTGSFAHELVIPLQNVAIRKMATLQTPTSVGSLTRNFALGSEWVYFKIYCGVKTADDLLINVIKPLTEEFLRNEQIDQWFFIRYADPDFHLRVRFHGKGNFYGRVIELLYTCLDSYLKNGAVTNLVTEIYKREIERYGIKTMLDSEMLFFHDSVFCVNLLAWLQEEGTDENRRWLLAVRSVDELLTSFGLNLQQKRHLMMELRASFQEEFKITTQDAKKALAKKFREHRNSILTVLANPLSYNTDSTIEQLLEQRTVMMAPAIHSIRLHLTNLESELTLVTLIKSHVHMLLNRLIRSKPRMHEMVLYDFIYQHYTSVSAKENSAVTPFDNRSS